MIKNPRVEFVGGSNWVAIAASRGELAGVKSDGSLWRASWYERVDKEGHVAPYHAGSPVQKGTTVRAAAMRIERIGSEFDWVEVAAAWSHFVALKRDGTIWGWGNNGNKQLGDDPKFVTNAPVQIGLASNWTAVYAGAGHSYAVNREGEIWKWGKFNAYNGDPFHRKSEEGPVKLNIKVPGVRNVIRVESDLDLILDTDGNLWGLGFIPLALGGGGFGNFYYSEPKRIGGTNWLSVSCNWQALDGIKSDGTLWSQRGYDFYNWPLPKLSQLGRRNDWIAVKADRDYDLALAKDGTICRFGEPHFTSKLNLLASTRRVTWSINVLDGEKSAGQ
jgi:alpha-tubulin suppressor-like RCC1 family protein